MTGRPWQRVATGPRRGLVSGERHSTPGSAAAIRRSQAERVRPARLGRDAAGDPTTAVAVLCSDEVVVAHDVETGPLR